MPGLLQDLALRCLFNGLNGYDGAVAEAADRRDTRARRYTMDMDGVGAVQCHSAAEFGAGHTEHIAYNLKQGSVVIDIDTMGASVDLYVVRHGVLK